MHPAFATEAKVGAPLHHQVEIKAEVKVQRSEHDGIRRKLVWYQPSRKAEFNTSNQP